VGQQTPIVLVREGERWVVVDGYKRVRAVHGLGRDVVRAAEWLLSELEALVLERVMRASDGDSAIEAPSPNHLRKVHCSGSAEPGREGVGTTRPMSMALGWMSMALGGATRVNSRARVPVRRRAFCSCAAARG
jgi:hypothetical protein